jgi:hypothetical protein
MDKRTGKKKKSIKQKIAAPSPLNNTASLFQKQPHLPQKK